MSACHALLLYISSSSIPAQAMVTPQVTENRRAEQERKQKAQEDAPSGAAAALDPSNLFKVRGNQAPATPSNRAESGEHRVIVSVEGGAQAGPPWCCTPAPSSAVGACRTGFGQARDPLCCSNVIGWPGNTRGTARTSRHIRR